MGNSEMFERLAAKEEESNQSHAPVGIAATTGALAGGALASQPVVKDAVDQANLTNAIDERKYLDAKDRNLRYRYSQAQSGAIRSRLDGLNEEIGLPADKANWTQRQRELREAQANKIRHAALDRTEAYFHPTEHDLVHDGMANHSRKMRGADYDELLHQTFNLYQETPHRTVTAPHIDINKITPRFGAGALVGAAGLGGAAHLIHRFRNRPEMEQTARAFSDALEKFAAVTQQEAGPDSESRVPQYAGGVAAGAGAFAGRSQGMKDIQYHNDMVSGLTDDAILNRYYETKLKNLTARREGLEEGVENLIDGAKQNLGNYFGGDKQREIHSMSDELDAARALEQERLPGYRKDLLQSMHERTRALNEQKILLAESVSRLKPQTVRGGLIGGGIGVGTAGALAGLHHLKGRETE